MKEINLRPYREKQDLKIKRNVKIALFLSVLISVVFVVLKYNEVGDKYHNSKQDYDNLEETMTQLKNFNIANEDIESQRINALGKMKLSYNLYTGKAVTAKFLDKMVVLFPSEKGYLTSISKNDSKIEINGVFSEEDELHSFLYNLKEETFIESYEVREIYQEKGKTFFKVLVNESIK